MESIKIMIVHKNRILRSHPVDFLAQPCLKILADIDSLPDLQGLDLVDAERIFIMRAIDHTLKKQTKTDFVFALNTIPDQLAKDPSLDSYKLLFPNNTS